MCDVETTDRPCGVVAVAECFLLRTRPANASVIRAAVDLDDVSANLTQWDVAVLGYVRSGRRTLPKRA